MSIQGRALQTWESIQLLERGGIGRLCIIDGGCPIAIPVNFSTVDASTLVVRTEANSLIGGYRGAASLETDSIDLAARTAWSVIARGTLGVAGDQTGFPDPEPWVGGDRFRWMRLAISALSSRRFSVVQSGDGFTVEWQSL